MDTNTRRTAIANVEDALNEMAADIFDTDPVSAASENKPSRARKKQKTDSQTETKPKTTEAKPKKTVAKARAKKKPAAFDFEALAADKREALIELEGTVQSLGRKTTEQTFELGAVFDEAGAMLEDQTFKGWVKERCGYEDRTARLYRDVHRSLQPWRKRLVANAVKATVMFKLAAGEKEAIEEIVSDVEAGKKLTVKDVEKRLKGEDGEADDSSAIGPYDRSGLSGLLFAAQARSREDAATFGKVLSSIRSEIGEVLEATPNGKRIQKKGLADKIEHPARHAKALLEALLYSSQPNPNVPGYIWPVVIPNGSSWAKVHTALHDLGGKDTWRPSGELREWLETEVMPAFDFALSKEKVEPLVAPNASGPVAAGPDGDAAKPIDGEMDAESESAEYDIVEYLKDDEPAI